MKRKLLSILLVYILMISVVGCGKKSNSSSENVTKVGKLDLEVEEIYDFHDGLARIRVNDKIGFIDKLGNIVVEPKYDSGLNFSDGLALVCNKDLENSDFYNPRKNCGYIDTTGKEVIELKYEDGVDFVNGVSIVKKGIKAAFIDKTGKELTGFNYTFVSSKLLGDNMALVSSTDVKTGSAGWNIINIKDSYKPILSSDSTVMNALGCSKGLCAVKQAYVDGKYDTNGKYGFVDYNGNVVIDYKFDTAFSFNENDFALVEVNDKVGFINTKGEYILEPNYYNIARGIVEYDSDLILLDKDDENVVAFDKTGKELFTTKGHFYEDGYVEGYAVIRENGSDNFIFINEKGKQVFDSYYRANNFSEGLALVRPSKDEFKFINDDGKVILGGTIGKSTDKKSNSDSKKDSSNTSKSSSETTNKSNSNSTVSNSNNTNNNSSSSSNSTSNSNNSSSKSSITSEGIKIDNKTMKYGTYNGAAAAEGITLKLNSDGTCTYDGKSCTYKLGTHDFAQDSSTKGSYKNCIIVDNGYKYYFYPLSDTNFTDGGINDFIYSGN